MSFDWKYVLRRTFHDFPGDQSDELTGQPPCSFTGSVTCPFWWWEPHLTFSSHQGPPLISITFQDDRGWPQNYISQLSQQPSVLPMGAWRSKLGQEKHSEFWGMEENTEMSQAEWEFQTKFIREALTSQTEATRYRKDSLTFKIPSEGSRGTAGYNLSARLSQWFISKELHTCNWAFIQLHPAKLRMANHRYLYK